jgi:RimJ/RimL family protein N-acetyltransferase
MPARQPRRGWATLFDVLQAPRVISVADAPNRRSIVVMRRIGLCLDHYAELADGDETFEAAIYSLPADAWRAARG